MWRPVALVLGILIAVSEPATLRADEDSHPGVSKLLDRLSPEGLSGKVLQLSRWEPGRRAIGEALDASASWKLRGFERDADSRLEEHLFTRDADGFVTLRPERQEELKAISARVTLAKPLFEAFTRRADELAGKIGEGSELDRRVKAAWKSPAYLFALFHDFARDDGEGEGSKDPAARMESFFSRHLEETFEQKGGELVVKPQAFADDDGAASPEEMERKLGGGEFAEARAVWADLADRCVEAPVAEVFASPLAVSVLEEFRDRLVESWIAQTRLNAWEGFARRYLVLAGDRYQWRPDRAEKVSELHRRAREIARELASDEAGGREVPPEPTYPLDGKPIVIDESVIPKDERRPDLVARVRSVLVDDPVFILGLRLPAGVGELARDVTVLARAEAFRYVGIEAAEQKPTEGYVAYVWLNPEAKDKAVIIRFAREK